MRTMVGRIVALAVAAGLAGFASNATAAGLVPPEVPADYEAVAAVNVRRIVDSDLFKTVMEREETSEALARLKLVDAVTGVDVLKDLDRVVVFGRIDDDASAGVRVEGRFEKDRLVTLIEAAGEATTFEHGGLTIHQWKDKDKNATKYGAFLPTGEVMIWNSKAAMEACVAAAKGAGAGGDASFAALVPADDPQLMAWAVIVPRSKAKDFDKIQLKSAAAQVRLTGDAVRVRISVLAGSRDAAERWAKLAQGVVAAAQLQREKPVVADIAGKAVVEASPDGDSVSLEIPVPLDMVKKAIKEAEARKKD